MSDAIAQQITIPPILPATAVILCSPSFVNTLAQVELEVARLAIATPQDSQAGAHLLSRLTSAGVALEKARKDVKQPFLDKCKEIDNAAAAPATRIESAKRLIKTKVAAYDAEQAEIARKAEQARLAEVARLEKLAREEQAERERKAADLARIARENQEKARLEAERLAAAGKPAPRPVVDLDWEDEPLPAPEKTETEKQLEAAKFAPVVAAPKPVGISFRVTLLLDAIDVNKLPDLFVVKTANERALRATYCQGFKDGDAIPEVPGVTFRVHKEPVSTGRAVF